MGYKFPGSEELPNPRIEPTSLMSPVLHAGRFFADCSIAGLYSMIDSDKYNGGKNTMKEEGVGIVGRGDKVLERVAREGFIGQIIFE